MQKSRHSDGRPSPVNLRRVDLPAVDVLAGSPKYCMLYSGQIGNPGPNYMGACQVYIGLPTKTNVPDLVIEFGLTYRVG